MSFFREDSGSLALATLLVLPVILVVLTGVLDLGVLRVVAERARIAADLATVTAVNDQDDGYLAATGRIRTAPDADLIAREQFALNLEPLRRSLAIAPEEVARTADIANFASGGTDPRTGTWYEAPTVRIAVDLPVLTPGLAALLARPTTLVRIFSASSAR